MCSPGDIPSSIPSTNHILLEMQNQDSESVRLHAIFDEAREKFQKHCPGPAPEDLFVRAQWTMSNMYVYILLIIDDESLEDERGQHLLTFAFFL
jgi:hypothetical protein